MMKTFPFLCAALCAALLPRLSAAPVEADSRITAVTVYRDRAVVTRTVGLEVNQSGPLDVVFARLPAGLLEQSLQVTGRGTAQTTVLDVGARVQHVEFAPNERVKTLEDQLRALGRQERELADRGTVLTQQRDYVVRIQQATTTPPTESTGALPLANTWLQLLTFTEEQLTKLAAETQSIDAQREELAAKRAALERQLGELRGDNGRSYQTVTVRLTTANAGHLDLTLRYAVPAAGWTPSYDARVLSSEREVQLGYFGVVRQNTGEDWRGIELSLSTARPSLGGEPPELSPWIVQQQEIRPLAKEEDAVVLSPFEIKRKGARGNMSFAAAPAAMTEAVQARTLEAQLDTQTTSATFKIPVAADIPSDNTPQKVPITSTRLASAPEYLATPKLLPAAFLTAKVTNTSEFPLLAGAMNVFLDDTFVAASQLRTVMPGEKFDLALGADEGLTIKRKLNNRFTEDTGLVTKSKRITYDYTLTVQNNKKSAEKIVLQDQVPVSRHEKIIVKVIAPDEKQAKPDAEGALKWTLTLNAGEKRELPLKFSIEYPVDLPVTGVE